MQQVVAIGYIGSGKTTLFNKCCNKSQETQPGGESVTKSAFLTSSAYGKGFRMLDTPGLGADRQKMDHTIGIANALSEGDIHMILVVVKFDRLPLMKRYFKEIIEQKLSRFKNLITVAVTFWDSIKQQLQKHQNLEDTQNLRMKEIKDYLTSINVLNSIFVSIEDNGLKICQQIDQILKQNTQGQKCILSQTEIKSYFDLIDETEDIQKRLSDTSGLLIKEFSDICKSIKKWINNFDSNHPSLSDIMHQLTIEIKDIAEKTVTEFELKNMGDFYQLYEENEEVIYYIHSKLKAEIVSDVKSVQELAQKKMYNNKLHVYNFLKQCPNCKLIWFKVSGCDNTTCGNFPTTDDSHFSQQAAIKRFKFQFSSSGVVFYDLGTVSQINTKSYQLGAQEKLKKGCGQPLNWSALKGLDENQIKELCDPGVIDYLAQVDYKMQFKSKKLDDQIKVALEKNKVQQI